MFALILLSGIGLILILCGFLIRYKNAYWLISGYNTMSEEEKSYINTDKMARVMFVSCLLMGLSVIGGGVFFYFGLDVAGIIGIFLVFPIVLVTLIASQKCNLDPERSNSKAGIIVFAVFMILILSFAGWMVGAGAKQSTVAVDGTILDISGMYGQSFDLSEAQSAEIKTQLPSDLIKKNGYNFGSVLKGSFDSDIGRLRLYVNTDAPMFLYVFFDGETLILSTQSREETQALYAQILSLIQP